MKLRYWFIRVFVLPAVISMGFACTGRSQTVGIDFSGSATALSGATAGAFPAPFWNDVDGTSGSLTAGTITDNTDNDVTGLSATWGANGSASNFAANDENFDGSDPNQVADQALYTGGLFTFGNATVSDGSADGYFSNLTLSGIPYSSYDVYVYFSGDGSTKSGMANINGVEDGTTLTGGTTLQYSDANDITDYVAADANGDPADYAEYTDVTGSTLSVYVATTDPNNSDISLVGVQIVNTAAVPEPATYAMALCGAGFLLGFRKFRRNVR